MIIVYISKCSFARCHRTVCRCFPARSDAGTCHHCRYVIPAQCSGVETARVLRFAPVWETQMGEVGHPTHTAKRLISSMFFDCSRRYTPQLAVISFHQNFCAVEPA